VRARTHTHTCHTQNVHVQAVLLPAAALQQEAPALQTPSPTAQAAYPQGLPGLAVVGSWVRGGRGPTVGQKTAYDSQQTVKRLHGCATMNTFQINKYRPPPCPTPPSPLLPLQLAPPDRDLLAPLEHIYIYVYIYIPAGPAVDSPGAV
jgi:hypothetical protein